MTKKNYQVKKDIKFRSMQDSFGKGWRENASDCKRDFGC